MRMGQPSGRATVALLAKPEVWMPVAFTATFCTIPLHVAYFTYPAFHESFGFIIFCRYLCFFQQKIYSASQGNIVSTLGAWWLLRNFSLVLCQGHCCPLLSKQWHQKWGFFAYAAEFLMVLICHILSLFRFWQQPVLNWDYWSELVDGEYSFNLCPWVTLDWHQLFLKRCESCCFHYCLKRC